MKYILLILGLAFILWEPLRAFFSKRSKREKWDQDKKLAVLLVCNWFFLLGLILATLYINHYNKNWWFAPRDLFALPPQRSPWHVQMVKLTPEDWKEILTASFDREMVRIAQGLDGGMVLLGHRTSKWGRKRFGEWLEFLHAASAHHGVVIEPATVPEPLGRAS